MGEEPPLEEWAETAATDQDAVVEHIPVVIESLTAEHSRKRNKAVTVLSRIAKGRSDAVVDALPALVKRVEGDESDTVRHNSALAIKRVTEAHPDECRQAIPALVGGLTDDDGDTREKCRAALNQFGAEADEEIADAVSTLATEAAKQTTANALAERNAATLNLARLALWDPDSVATHRAALRERLDDTNNVVRYHAAMAYKRMAVRDPTLVTEAVETLGERLRDDDEDVRELSSKALSSVAEECPERIAESGDALVAALADQHETVRTEAAAALNALVSVSPGAVTPARAALVKLLSDSQADCREAARKTLHGLADEHPTEVGATLAETYDVDVDPSEPGSVHETIETVASEPSAHSPGTGGEHGADDAGSEAAETLQRLATLFETAGPDQLSMLDESELEEFLTTIEGVDAEAVPSVDAETLDEMRASVREALGGGAGGDRVSTHRIDPSTPSSKSPAGWDEEALVDLDGRPDHRCSYARELGPYAGDQEDDVWACHRESRDNGEYCLFHAPVEDTDDEAVRDAFLAAVNERGRESKEFVGARFGELELSFDILNAPDNYPIDLRHATVEGSINCRRAEFGQPLRFDGGTIGDIAKFTVATFDSWVNFDGASLGMAVFGKATFSGGATFEDATIDEESVFTGATFESRAVFKGATFGDVAEFSKVVFDFANFDNVDASARFDLANVVCDRTLRMNGIDFEKNLKLLGGRMRDLRLSGATVDGDIEATRVTVEKSVQGGDLTVSGDLLLSGSVVRNNLMLDDMTAGGFNFEGSTVLEQCSLQEATVDGQADCSMAAFEGMSSFEGAEFDDDLTLTMVSFGGFLILEGLSVAGDLDLSGASNAGRIDLSEITVDGDADLSAGEFDGPVLLDDARVGGSLDASRSRFGSFLAISQVTVDGVFNAEAARFSEEVDIRAVDCSSLACYNLSCDADFAFRLSEIDGETEFSDTEFAEDATFGQTSFDGHATFEHIAVDGRATFDGAIFERGCSFSGSTFEAVDYIGTSTGEGSIVDLRDCELHAGDIVLPGDGNVAYDLANATLGDVDIADNFGSDGETELFEHFRFANTVFDGFDFGRYKDELAASNWHLHTTIDDVEFPNPARQELFEAVTIDEEIDDGMGEEMPENIDMIDMLRERTGMDREVLERLSDVEDISELPSGDRLHEMTGIQEFRDMNTPGNIENTYLKAKNGADQVGDRHVAAQFFVHEMKHRRQKNTEIVRDSAQDLKTRTLSAGKVVGNFLLHQSCGYGERLWRVVYASLMVIIGWTVMYATLTKGTSGSAGGLTTQGLDGLGQLFTPQGIDIFIKNLYFSVVTFTTLGYGDIQPVGTVARFLAGLESFLGALLVALVVFVMGRRVSW